MTEEEDASEELPRSPVRELVAFLFFYAVIALLLNGGFWLGGRMTALDWLKPPLLYGLIGGNALGLLVAVALYDWGDAFMESVAFCYHLGMRLSWFLFFSGCGGAMLYFAPQLEEGANLIMAGSGLLILAGGLWQGYGFCKILMAGAEGFRELDWVKNHGSGNSGGGCGGCGGGGCGGGG